MILESFVAQQAIALVVVLIALRAITRPMFPSMSRVFGRLVMPVGLGIIGSLLLRTLRAVLL